MNLAKVKKALDHIEKAIAILQKQGFNKTKLDEVSELIIDVLVESKNKAEDISSEMEKKNEV